MQFNSLAYLLFLPTAFALYWGLPKRWRNVVVVAMSFIFYGWWDVRFLGLMIATCSACWALALLIGKGGERMKKWLCGFAVTIGLGVLGIFKYFDFFSTSLSHLIEECGGHGNLPLLNIVLPVGISFYTFQAIGYVIDVYRGNTPPCKSIWQFFAFVSFFPQLVAGPIERSGRLLPQFASPRQFNRGLATEGMQRILWGLLKKMILADTCGAVADHIFANSAAATTGELWVGAICFAFQIYGDFSAYSDIAIGSAQLFGIRLMENFDRPYFSQSIPEFWRRWHISLMTWLRDYVYIPLGGGREGKWRKWRNTFLVFALSGLWHGAGWTYITWGIYHAILFIPYSVLPWLNKKHQGIIAFIKSGGVFILILFGWVFFRAENIDSALAYLQGMLCGSYGDGVGFSRLPLLYIVTFMTVEGLRGCLPLAFKQSGIMKYAPLRMFLYLVFFIAALLLGGRPSEFIYFQF